MEEKTVKILSKLDQVPNGPFIWTTEIDGEQKKLCSWETRELDVGETYIIMLLDEDAKNDATYNQRRMSKKHEPKLFVEGVIEQLEEIKEETKEEDKVPKQTTKKKTKTEAPPKDDFDDMYSGMIEDEANDKSLSSPKANSVSEGLAQESKVSKESQLATTNLNTNLAIPEGSKLEISFENIKKHIAPKNVTDTEVYLFLQLCINQGLNPFIGDIYLVKYGTKAQFIVSKDAFLKKAEQLPDYLGFEAGVIVTSDEGKTFDRREGALKLDDEVLIGGWAKVYRENKKTFYAEVSFKEYNTGKAMWVSKPSTMIRKVSLVQCLREAFPASFQGMFDKSEMETGDNQ